MIARLRSAISRQLARPSGRAGRIVATAMNRGNRDLNARAIELLDAQAGHRVLDVGFGGALTFKPLLQAGAAVIGIDRAEGMVLAASRRHSGDDRVTVHIGDVSGLPLEDGAVDRALTVNAVYFWPDLPAALIELRRVLVPGGRLVIGIRDGTVMDQVDLDVFTIRTHHEIAAALTAVGYADVDIRSAVDRKTHLIVGAA